MEKQSYFIKSEIRQNEFEAILEQIESEINSFSFIPNSYRGDLELINIDPEVYKYAVSFVAGVLVSVIKKFTGKSKKTTLKNEHSDKSTEIVIDENVVYIKVLRKNDNGKMEKFEKVFYDLNKSDIDEFIK